VVVLTRLCRLGCRIQQLPRRAAVPGMVQGDGDGLRINEAGIETLGSWEPLPAGPALIDYWRATRNS
jgi:hypothetical protein